MGENRRTLSLKSGGLPPADREAGAALSVGQAIERQLLVRWTYNRTLMQAAPQILYRRNGGLYVDAIVTEKNGAPPVERKLGSFRLTGLGNISLTSESFTPAGDIDLADPRYKAGVIARAA